MKRSILFAVVFVLVFGSPVLRSFSEGGWIMGPQLAFADEPSFKVTVQNQTISIEAKDASALEVLKDLGEKAGVEVRVYEGVDDKKVNLNIQDLPIGQMPYAFKKVGLDFVYGREEGQTSSIIYIHPKGMESEIEDLKNVERIATSAQDIERIEYKKKVLKDFIWGSGPDQLGIKRPLVPEGMKVDWSAIVGPKKIIVNDDGEIFIRDVANRRTVKIDSKNSMVEEVNEFPFLDVMTFAVDGCLYTLSAGTFPGSITRYDNNFKIIDSISVDSRELVQHVVRDLIVIEDNIYLLTLNNLIKVNMNATKEKLELKSNINIGSVEVSPMQFNPRPTKMFSRKNLMPIPVDIAKFKKSGWSVGIPRIFKEDVNGNYYMMMSVSKYTTKKITYQVLVFNKQGNLSNRINLDDNEDIYSEIYTPSLVDVDKNGNVYQLVVSSLAAKLIFWGKQDAN